MNKKIFGVSLLVLALIVGSCNQDTNKKNDKGDEVIEKANDLLEATGDYVVNEITDFEKRLENYQEKTKDRLTRVNEWVDDMSAEGRKKYQKQVDKLEKQQKELDKKVKAYKRAGEEKKKDIRKEIEKLNDGIRKSYETFEREMRK